MKRQIIVKTMQTACTEPTKGLFPRSGIPGWLPNQVNMPTGGKKKVCFYRTRLSLWEAHSTSPGWLTTWPLSALFLIDQRQKNGVALLLKYFFLNFITAVLLYYIDKLLYHSATRPLKLTYFAFYMHNIIIFWSYLEDFNPGSNSPSLHMDHG